MRPFRTLAPFALVAAALALAPATARATTIFSEDFESGAPTPGAPNWVSAGHAVIVSDPLGGANDVLGFTATAQAGDLFSRPIPTIAGATYYVSFDYLGLTTGVNGGRSGGALGFAGNFYAVADTTYNDGNVVVRPATDGAWHHYQLSFTATGLSGQLMLEDFMGPGGNNQHAGDAFFDNIVVADAPPTTPGVPEPATAGALLLGALSILGRRALRAA